MKEFLRCKDCKHDKGKCAGSSRRGGHKNCFEKKTLTNGDRIRAMRDEELAEFFCSCEFCDVCDGGCAECRYDGDCKQSMVEWLRKPAEEVQGDV